MRYRDAPQTDIADSYGDARERLWDRLAMQTRRREHPDMSETDGLYLARTLRGELEKIAPGSEATWLSRNAVDPATGKSTLNVSSANEILKTPRKSWLNPPSIRGIAAALKWRDEAVYIPNAVSIGLTAPRDSRIAAMLPSWVDDLPAESWRDIRAYVELQGRAHGLTE